MSAPPGKIEEWLQRGKQPMSAAQIKQVLERVPRFLPLPKEIITLDGIMEVGNTGAVAVGATPRIGGSTVILSPIADQETLMHELVHTWGYGETAAYALGPLMTRRFEHGLIAQLRPPRRLDIEQGPPMSPNDLTGKFDMVPSGHFFQEMQEAYQWYQAHDGLSALKGIRVYKVLD